MAGAYPDSPGRKMNTAEDGTLLHRFQSTNAGTPDRADGPLTEYTATATHDALGAHGSTDIANLGAGSSAGTYGLGFIFPELRDVDGTWAHITPDPATSGGLLHSADTTNILDGSWTAQSTVLATIFNKIGGSGLPSYRDDVYSWTVTSKRGIQIFWNVSGIGAGFWRGFEIYGEIASGETPDRIIMLDDDTGLEYAIPQDYGDRPRGSAIDKSMRLKNNSGTKQANTIDVARGVIETVGDSSSWYTFDNGGGFGASFQVSSLGAGASDTFVVRQNIPDASTLQLYEAYIKIDVTSWT